MPKKCHMYIKRCDEPVTPVSFGHRVICSQRLILCESTQHSHRLKHRIWISYRTGNWAACPVLHTGWPFSFCLDTSVIRKPCAQWLGCATQIVSKFFYGTTVHGSDSQFLFGPPLSALSLLARHHLVSLSVFRFLCVFGKWGPELQMLFQVAQSIRQWMSVPPHIILGGLGGYSYCESSKLFIWNMHIAVVKSTLSLITGNFSGQWWSSWLSLRQPEHFLVGWKGWKRAFLLSPKAFHVKNSLVFDIPWVAFLVGLQAIRKVGDWT